MAPQAARFSAERCEYEVPRELPRGVALHRRTLCIAPNGVDPHRGGRDNGRAELCAQGMPRTPGQEPDRISWPARGRRRNRPRTAHTSRGQSGAWGHRARTSAQASRRRRHWRGRLWHKERSRPKLAEQFLASRPGKIPATVPPKLRDNYWRGPEALLKSCSGAEASPKFSQIWPTWVICWLSLANLVTC